MKRLALVTLALLVSACGLREPLQPPPGQSLPVAPAAADRRPDAEALLTPPTNARPDRVGELLPRSEERENDRFDLPPPEEVDGPEQG